MTGIQIVLIITIRLFLVFFEGIPIFLPKGILEGVREKCL
jgi:hypothetical protein